jgi:hypothetical protein
LKVKNILNGLDLLFRYERKFSFNHAKKKFLSVKRSILPALVKTNMPYMRKSGTCIIRRALRVRRCTFGASARETGDKTRFHLLKNSTFLANRTSGLTDKAGWYLIYNQKTNQFYLGAGNTLALRKADYNRNFKDYFKTGSGSIYTSFKTSIEKFKCKRKDFFFIPLYYFVVRDNSIQLDPASARESQKAQIKTFAQAVESAVIHYFVNHKVFQKRIYNVKTTSQWEIGNTFGGHENSGQPPNAVAQFKGPYAFESISCCASFYRIDRKSVRNALKPRARKAQTFIEITSEAFDAWDEDFKITRENADFFNRDYVISQGLPPAKGS